MATCSAPPRLVTAIHPSPLPHQANIATSSHAACARSAARVRSSGQPLHEQWPYVPALPALRRLRVPSLAPPRPASTPRKHHDVARLRSLDHGDWRQPGCAGQATRIAAGAPARQAMCRQEDRTPVRHGGSTCPDQDRHIPPPRGDRQQPRRRRRQAALPSLAGATACPPHRDQPVQPQRRGADRPHVPLQPTATKPRAPPQPEIRQASAHATIVLHAPRRTIAYRRHASAARATDPAPPGAAAGEQAPRQPHASLPGS